jgi:hypothetical protein
MERRSDRSDRSERSDGLRSETVVAARMSLALWLRAGRAHRGMTVDDVAKVTKIQPRILERLEAGKLDGLPAEVFVRGFVRSFARCVGLDETEALQRHAACGLAGDSQDLTPTVRALIESMSDLAPGSATAIRATPRKMQAVGVPEALGVPEVLGVPDVLGVRDVRDLPQVIDLAPVQTRLLPETGTLPALAPATALAEAMADHDGAGTPAVAVAIEPAGAEGAPSPSPAAVVGLAAAAPAVEPAAEPPSAPSAPPPSALSAPAITSSVASSAVPGGAPGGSKKKRHRRRKARGAVVDGCELAAEGPARERLAPGTPPAASSVVATATPEPIEPFEPFATPDPEIAAGEPSAPWAPKMPPIAATPSVPWRRPGYRIPSVLAPAVPATSAPSLVIDDADPERAERVLEERAEKLVPRRSFLPPILLDREDRSARQGGLTLAVILLLIAATLTLSYLMRRPSASGDGMTRRELPADRTYRIQTRGPDAERGPAALG